MMFFVDELFLLK